MVKSLLQLIEETKSQQTLLDLAVEFQKYQNMMDVKKMKSIDEKYQEIETQSKKVLKKIQNNLSNFKKDTRKKLVTEVAKHKQEWEREFNNNMYTGKSNNRTNLKLPDISCMKSDVAPLPPKRDEPDDQNSEHSEPEINKELVQYYSSKFESNNMELSESSLNFLSSKIFKNEKKNIKLLYRLSKKKKKFEGKKFQKNTKDHENVLVICISETGEEFGGFAGTGWNTNNKDFSKNFLFSLSKQTIHQQTKNVSKSNSLEYSEDNGPCFGEIDLLVGNDCCNEASSTSYLGNFFEFEGSDAKSHLAGKNQFIITDCLVYTIKE